MLFLVGSTSPMLCINKFIYKLVATVNILTNYHTFSAWTKYTLYALKYA